MRRLLSFLLSLCLLATTQSFAHAQTAAYAEITAIDAENFPQVTGLVDVFNANKAYSRNFFGDNNSTTDIFDAWTPDRHTKNPHNIASDPERKFQPALNLFY